jgi:hypothetical protein
MMIDFENIQNNSFILANQFKVHARETKIPDVVMSVNGIPLVVGEAKTPVRPAVSWLDGAHDINVIYENAIPQLFVPNVFSFATEGKELFIGAVRTPLEFWSPWRIEEERDEDGKDTGEEIGLDAGQEPREHVPAHEVRAQHMLARNAPPGVVVKLQVAELAVPPLPSDAVTCQ